MHYTVDVGRQAAGDVAHFLHTCFVPPLWPRTVAVHMARFAERRTSTPVGADQYITVGRLVPIAELLAEVPGIYQFQKTVGAWKMMT